MPDEETARRIRAKRVREQIDRLVVPRNETEKDVREEESVKESPREFIHRKMREWGSKEESSR
jgi:hypothetical protein